MICLPPSPKHEALYIPAESKAVQAQLKRWQEGTCSLTPLNTVRSAKDFFFPQTENLVDFQDRGQEDRDHRHPDRSRKTFVALRRRAPAMLRSFDDSGPGFPGRPGGHATIRPRREHGTIVSMACTQPGGNLLLPHLWHRRGHSRQGDVAMLDDGGRALFAARRPKRARRCWTALPRPFGGCADAAAVKAQQAADREKSSKSCRFEASQPERL